MDMIQVDWNNGYELRGFDKKISSPSLDVISYIYGKIFPINQYLLQKMFLESKLSLDVMDDRPRTSDGYFWFADVRDKEGAFAMLFPWYSASKSRIERSIDLYVVANKFDRCRLNYFLGGVINTFYSKITSCDN